MSMDMLEGEVERVRDYGLERLTMLSDGVFAIAMTLLALDLKAPDHWNGRFGDLWEKSGPSVLIFAFSFALCAIYWVYHRRTFRYYRKSDFVLTFTNVIVLALVTLLPFVARILAEAPTGSDAQLLYLGALAAIGATLALQWGWAAFPGKLTQPLSRGARIYLLANMLLVPVTMSGLGLLNARPGNSWSFGVIAVVWGALFWLRRKFASELRS